MCHKVGPRSWLVEFEHSAFPYHGNVPSTGKPFLNVKKDGRLGRKSARGEFWLDEHYADPHVLISVPAGFDPAKPAYIVLFFHGNETILKRDLIERQRIAEQVASSSLNAVLVAPQLARDALDSSAGHFWDDGFFAAFLSETANKMAVCEKDGAWEQRVAKLPVIVAAYSGGYNPTAAVLKHGGAGERIAGVALFDALYGEEASFEDWIAAHPSKLFVSAYGRSTRDRNVALAEALALRGSFATLGLPAKLPPAGIYQIDAGDEAEHRDFMTHAWTKDPLADLLRRWPATE